MVTSSKVPLSTPERRLALVFANGEYHHRRKLSKTVSASQELEQKLMTLGFEVTCAVNQDLHSMSSQTRDWLRIVEQAEDSDDTRPLFLLFCYCGHGHGGTFLPIDTPQGPVQLEKCYSLVDGLLLPLIKALGSPGSNDDDSIQPLLKLLSLGGSREMKAPKKGFDPFNPFDPWDLPPCPAKSRKVRPPVQVLIVVEACRKLASQDKQAFEMQRARIERGHRHLIPSFATAQRGPRHMSGALWDADEFSFLVPKNPEDPRFTLALSSESTMASYDAHFLRSIVDAIDKPVKLGGILERAKLDTMRRTGFKQTPAIMNLAGNRGEFTMLDTVLACYPLASGSNASVQKGALERPPIERLR
eukprot:gnl/MRDRNA2_/MRDRNA2_115247_c0_seq1.p1 gnl/MRDRNA2_/MRDRNA2_115247_c0~~gnl/MRDRNA2_/MRDRNA2_115247_c0_seq1.p1  ORF type:complete len:359 (+),score=57.27 gnl/MRDRNA2_/MRDRNA2_115247_c0_seq1:80-1156(+)